jgi:alanyl-tRNA synthetase
MGRSRPEQPLIKETTMKTKTDFGAAIPQRLAKPGIMRQLEDDAGIFGRLQVRNDARREAGRALAVLKAEQASAALRIAQTAMAVTESKLTGALVTDGMAQISALAIENNQRTGAAIAQISASTGAERLAHLANRTTQVQAINARLARKELTEDEAGALRSYAESDLANDVESANRRAERSKTAVETLSEMALSGLHRGLRSRLDDE